MVRAKQYGGKTSHDQVIQSLKSKVYNTGFKNPVFTQLTSVVSHLDIQGVS